MKITKNLLSKFKRYLRICKYATRYGMTIKEYKEALNTTIDVNSFYPHIKWRRKVLKVTRPVLEKVITENGIQKALEELYEAIEKGNPIDCSILRKIIK